MSWEAWVTVAVVLALLVSLLKDTAPTDVLFLTAAVILASLGIITPHDALSGFANPGMLTVAALFVVATALRETGLLDHIGHHVLGRTKTARGAFLRVSGAVLPMSAFLNNTPVVAMFIPIVMDWCRRQQVSPSKLLIPLSFLSILGGTCTLVGTSTNLVVNGLLLDNQMPGMRLFELAWIGIPYAALGVLFFVTFGLRLLPSRAELLEQLGETRREYISEMLVQPQCRLCGMTVEASGLRGLQGLFLVEIDRNGEQLTPVRPDHVIHAGDQLVFAGIVSSIVELNRIQGLVPATAVDERPVKDNPHRRRLWEAVISPTSPLIRKTLRDADFRARYGAAVIAIHRGGQRVNQKLGDIKLRAGDTLLMQAGQHFRRAFRNDPAFYLISDVAEWRPLRRERAWLAGGIFAAVVLAMATGILPTEIAALLGALLMIATRCISSGEARQSIEWPVLITIASSFALGQALQQTGAASHIANLLVNATESLGPVAALAAIFVLTSVVTELITNNAAAVLLFPFCLETAKLYSVSPKPFIIALVLAASASFLTPIGYQTNMMVYGPGGYRYGDFVRIGAPLNLLLWVVATILVPLIWPFSG
jgi:di/tricarboxylate transporter